MAQKPKPNLKHKMQTYNRDEDGTEAKTQFETPNAKVHSDENLTMHR